VTEVKGARRISWLMSQKKLFSLNCITKWSRCTNKSYFGLEMKVHIFCSFCMCHKELITWESTRTPEHKARLCVSLWPQCHVTLLWPGVACIWSRNSVLPLRPKTYLKWNQMHWESELQTYCTFVFVQRCLIEEETFQWAVLKRTISF